MWKLSLEPKLGHTENFNRPKIWLKKLCFVFMWTPSKDVSFINVNMFHFISDQNTNSLTNSNSGTSKMFWIKD